jgi:hypothetical protein
VLLAASQGDEDHILPAGSLDLPRGDQAPSIPQQDDLQENLGIVGGAPLLIVTVFLLKTRGIQPGFYQCVDGELQGPGHQLVRQRHWQKNPLPIIVCLEFSHVPLCLVFFKLAQNYINIQQFKYVILF